MGYGKERPCKKCLSVKLIMARGLCTSCFSSCKKAGTLDEYPALKPPVVRNPQAADGEDSAASLSAITQMNYLEGKITGKAEACDIIRDCMTWLGVSDDDRAFGNLLLERIQPSV